ncbi:mechanosensitive ion channel domain-containing protein [Enhygromyxa salina]|uniref:Mechanosensitive ion channel n=1 Tax=Enhygromyxa salina TaxID=215803 RepID=A0A2S9YXK1_9BACT|nr:mechanosensitive ion channel domain-containing protein [Enhygromyxa salina]PRQ09825.1 Mechanosensitive ion channel [Enhygromyxa salina]
MDKSLALQAPLSLGARLLAEFDALLHISPLGLGIWLAFVLGVAWALAWAGPAIVRMVWRLGRDPRRRLGLLASGLRVLGLLVGVAGVLRPVFSRAPTLGVVAVLIMIVLAGLATPTQVRNLASGLSLATRSRVREGDLVTLGELEGTIREIGLLRVGLRTIDGGITHVPAAEFDRVAVTVGSRRAAMPIEAQVIAGPGFDELGLERLRRALWMSVYRRANSDLRLTHDPQTGLVEVRMDTWAATTAVDVQRHLRVLLFELTRSVTEAGEPTGDRPGEGSGEGSGELSGGAAGQELRA